MGQLVGSSDEKVPQHSHYEFTFWLQHQREIETDWFR